MSRILIIIATLNLIFGCFYYKSKVQNERPFKDSYPLLKEASDKLKTSYVDLDKVQNDQLTNGALKGMLKSLDRYSTYYTPDQNKAQSEDLEGRFAGVGVLFRVEDEGVLLDVYTRDLPLRRREFTLEILLFL